MRSPLPTALLDHARSYSGGPAAEPRDAATIVLLRDGQSGLETYLLRRARTLTFAPGFDVFPGGSVQESDHATIAWRGPFTNWAKQFKCSPEKARSLVVAAVRETFEESGILLADRPEGAQRHLEATSAQLRHDRTLLERSTLSFAEYADQHGLEVCDNLLAAWSHWLTPEFEPRRFDTRFLIAAVPDDQEADHVAGESEHGRWVPIQEAIDGAAEGTVSMLPPTLTTCHELARHDVASAMAAARAQVPPLRTGRLVVEDGEYFIQHERR